MYIIISGESGVGKDTLARELSELLDVEMPLGYTTRDPRDGEVEWVDYRYLTPREFMMLSEDMLDWEEYGGALYGTPKPKWGRDAIAVMGWEGYNRLKESYGDDVIGILLESNRDLPARDGGWREDLRRTLRENRNDYDVVINNDNYEDAVLSLYRHLKEVLLES